MFKKFLSILLMVTMVMTMTAFPVYADNNQASGEIKFMVEYTSLTEVPDGYIGVYTKEDLDNVRNDLDANYILMNDIVFEESDFEEGGAFYNEGKGWKPIGEVFYYDVGTGFETFDGIFNGNGYVISGLVVNSNVSAGLFGRVNGTVSNLGMEENNICGSYSGSIAAYVNGSVDNCYNTGIVKGSTAGGITGINYGKISRCYNTGNLICVDVGVDWDKRTGGIVGENAGEIKLCYNKGNINAEDISERFGPRAGGIAGEINDTVAGRIEQCYNAGMVASQTYAGGIAGKINLALGNTTNCFNLGTIRGKNAGGITVTVSEASVSNCYNVGNVTGGYGSGIAKGGYNATIENCYCIKKTNYEPAGTTQLSLDAIKKKASFKGFDFNNVWSIDDNGVYTLPYLKGLKRPETITISLQTVSGISNVTYTGKAITHDIVVKNGNTTLVEGKDYIVFYKNNTKVGTATVTITGKGNYTGTVNKNFTIKEQAQKPNQKNPFTDVKKDAYYYDAVLWAVEKGVTSGISATNFGPDYECTRGQVVTFLWRAAGQPKANVNNPFIDVKPDQFYYDAVLWAVEQGITTGTSPNTFSPDYTVNRGQFVTFLWRMQGQPTVSVKNPFKDVKAGQFYYDAVLWAYKTGVTTGTSANTFSPDYSCLRGQVVTFIYRSLG